MTPMGVAAAYLGEMVTEELKAMAAEDDLNAGGPTGRRSSGSGSGGRGGAREEPAAVAPKIVVVAPQEGQVRIGSTEKRHHEEEAMCNRNMG